MKGLISFFNPFSEDFIFGDLFSNVGELLSYINPFSENFFVYKLIDLLGDLLRTLFIPNQNSFVAIKNAIDEKLGFVESVKIAFNSVKQMLEGVVAAPRLTYSVNTPIYTGELTFLDMEFYRPFKPYGDLVFTGFAYVLFVYRLYIRLAGIINGSVDVFSGRIDTRGRGGSE